MTIDIDNLTGTESLEELEAALYGTEEAGEPEDDAATPDTP